MRAEKSYGVSSFAPADDNHFEIRLSMSASVAPGSDQVDVQFRELPVALFSLVSQYNDELLREFRLILADKTNTTHEVSAPLMRIIEEMSREFTAFVRPVRAAVESAIDQQLEQTNLVLPFPSAMRDWVQEFAHQFSEADRYCEAGKLLTLPAAPEIIAFRAWFLGQLLAQLDGAAPTSWTQYLLENP